MDAKRLIDVRKQAEKAVDDMPAGEIKIKAFEVILAHLLGDKNVSSPHSQEMQEPKAESSTQKVKRAKTSTGRILVLRDEGFFNSLRSMSEIREELRAHGWHYPATSLSGSLQSLVQQRELRRQRTTDGKKKGFKYSNP